MCQANSLNKSLLRALVLCASLLACNLANAQPYRDESSPNVDAELTSFKLGEHEVEFKLGELVAVVGEDHVIAAEVVAMINAQITNKFGDKVKTATPREMEAIQKQNFRPMLLQVIRMKMYSQNYMAKMVGTKSMKDRDQARHDIRMKINQAFAETFVPILLEQYNATSEVELDRKLREVHSSLENQKLTFMDSVLADEYMKGSVPKHMNIDILEVRDRFEQDKDKWQRPARVRFQKMSVLFKKFPDKNAAYNEIVGMFEEVRTGGAPFSSVAARRSQGAKAQEGGFFDWTTQGSLRSKEVDDAIFSIPLNRLSDIIEDYEGFHIVVVLEREDARVLPFAKAQDDVRKELENEKKAKIQQDLFDELQKKTPVFTKWPSDWPNARPLSDYSGVIPGQ